MKKIWIIVMTVALSAALAQAQSKPQSTAGKQKQTKYKEGSPREEAAERSVHITSGPTIAGLTPTSATIQWTTNKNAATDIHYGYGGGHEKIAYERGGSTHHLVTLSGLKPGQIYTYRIMTREKEVRFQGTFHTPGR